MFEGLILLVEQRGIEPLASALRTPSVGHCIAYHAMSGN